jgi:plastocyanin
MILLKSVLIIAIVAVAMIGVMVPSAFAVQTIQGAYIPYGEPYGCTSQDVMISAKHSMMDISLRAYTPNPDVNVVILADGMTIKNQSIPIKTWTSVSTVFSSPHYNPESIGRNMKLIEIKICLFNTSTDNGEKSLRLDSVKITTSSEKISTYNPIIKHSESNPTEVAIVTVDESGFSHSCVDTGCYTPSVATVDVGDTVTMTNTDPTGVHTFTSGTVNGFTPSPDGTFDTGVLMSGDAFEWVPKSAGEVPYYCMLHTWMVGEIIVQEAGAKLPLTVQTDKTTYDHDSTITITGQVANVIPRYGPITVTVLNPFATFVTIEQFDVYSDGRYGATMSTDGNLWKYDGTYTIIVNYGSLDNRVTVELTREVIAQAAAVAPPTPPVEKYNNNYNSNCTPSSVSFDSPVSNSFLLKIGNPDSPSCKYSASLYDMDRTKIKDLGTVTNIASLNIGESIPEGNYVLLVKVMNGDYSKFFPLLVDHPNYADTGNSNKITEAATSPKFTDPTNGYWVFITIAALVLGVVIALVAKKKKSKTDNTVKRTSQGTSPPPVDPKHATESTKSPIHSEPKKSQKKASPTRTKPSQKTATSSSSSPIGSGPSKTPKETLDELARKINQDYKTEPTSPPPVDPKHKKESPRTPIHSEPKKSQKKASPTRPKPSQKTVKPTIDSEVDRILNATDPLDVLGLPTSVSYSVIKATYRELYKKYDPSRGISNKSDIEKERDQKVSTNLNRAYEDLKRKNHG